VGGGGVSTTAGAAGAACTMKAETTLVACCEDDFGAPDVMAHKAPMCASTISDSSPARSREADGLSENEFIKRIRLPAHSDGKAAASV
jgi:hypothetical protein